MDTLRDVFAEQPQDDYAPPLAPRPDVSGGARSEPEPVVVHVADPLQVARDYDQMTERRRQAKRAAVARQNAATARAVAQSFGEYGRAFRKVAATKGSPVDHAVALALAAFCEQQTDVYTQLQADSTALADRAGSL